MQTSSLTIVRTSDELTETLQLWLESLQARGATQRTIDNYRECVGAFIRFLQAQGVDTLADVQPLHIRKWLASKRRQGVSPATLHNAYRNPRAWWNWCLQEELTRNNPFVKVEKPKVPLKLKPALSREDVARILSNSSGGDWLSLRNRAIILLALDTGLRASELHRLKVGDTKQSMVLIEGKGGKRRAVFLSHQARIAVKRYLSRCPFPCHDSEPLWRSIDGKPLTLSGLKTVVKLLGKKAGVKLGLHALRRTHAVEMLRNGCDLERLRLLMGHSSLKVLVEHYLPLTLQDLESAHKTYSPLNSLLNTSGKHHRGTKGQGRNRRA